MPMTLRDEYSHNQKSKWPRWKKFYILTHFESLHEMVKIFMKRKGEMLKIKVQKCKGPFQKQISFSN